MMPSTLFFVSVVLCLWYTNTAGIAGTLFVQDVKTDATGKTTANVLYFNDKGEVVPFSISDLKITESSRLGTASILDVQCPPIITKQDVSSVLTIDVSGSMKFGGPNILLARAAGQAWIEALGDSSESAITVFDHTASIRTFFTSDKSDLTKVISDIAPHGGTDYTEGLLDATEGGLVVASKGKKNRVLVFLTDGHGHVNADQVISFAKNNDITIYCVTLGMFMPAVLKEISLGTGGLWFDRVTTIDEAIMAYRRIFAHASGAKGCTVTWQSPPTCESMRTITFQIADARFEQSIPVPDQLRTSAGFTPQAVSFGVDTVNQQSFSITAKSSQLTINAVHVDRSDLFTIEAEPLPKTIQRGESIRINVLRKSFDSTYQVGLVSFDADPCPISSFYLASGDISIKPLKSTLRVIHPNGGERFLVRSLIPQQWEGLPPNVPVRVEVSTNAGYEWRTVTENGVANESVWRAIQQPTDSCLTRVTHLKTVQPTPNPLVEIQGGKFFRAAFSPNGELIATSEYTGAPGSRAIPPTVKLWNAHTGVLNKVLGSGDFIAFSPDGKSLAAWDHQTLNVMEMPSGNVRWSISLRTALVRCQISDNSSIIMVTPGGTDTTQIFDLKTGKVLNVLPHNGRDITMATMSGDGKQIALASRDGLVSLGNVGSTTEPVVINVPDSKQIFGAEYTKDGNLIAITSDNGVASLWNTTTGTLYAELSRRQYINDNTYIAISPDRRHMAVEKSTDITAVFDVATARPLVSMRRASDVGGTSGAGFLDAGGLMYITSLSKVTLLNAYTGVLTAVLPRGEGDPTAPADGKRIAVINRDLNVAIYPVEEPLLQQDVSDALWALYRPTGTMKNVEFASRFVGQAHDTIVEAAIENTSRDTLIVNNLMIESGHIGDFSISSQSELVIAPGMSDSISFSFHPRGVGKRNAVISVMTNGGKITARLTGTGLRSLVQIEGDTLDLGRHPVGILTSITADSILRNTNESPLTISSIKLISATDDALSLTSTAPFVVDQNSGRPLKFDFTPTSVRDVRGVVEVVVKEYSDPIHITVIAHAFEQEIAEKITDPTTFRSIMLPTSIVPKQGTVTTGVYDILGLQAGYSVTDNIMIIAGGALPLPNRWFGATGYDASWSAAWAIGGKYGTFVDSLISIGGGYTFGQSYYDQDITVALESKITFNALWVSAGYGTDDSRLNLYAGYAFKRHVTAFDGEYNANAVITGIAYDYRIAEHWKISSEAFFMRSMTFVPITLTARYFRSDDAFEVGVTYIGIAPENTASADIPLIPMVTWVKRW